MNVLHFCYGSLPCFKILITKAHFFLFLILYLFTFGTSETILADVLFESSNGEDFPGYITNVKWKDEGYKDVEKTLNGINEQTYKDRLKQSIQDFQKVTEPKDKIEITAEVFFNRLITFLFANDNDLKGGVKIYHQMDLKVETERRVIEYGHPDIVIEKWTKNGQQDILQKAMIIELKGFNTPWNDNSPDLQGPWQTQLCSYLYGYKVKRKYTAAGAISNLYRTQFYSCTVGVEDNKRTCRCFKSGNIYLFENSEWSPFHERRFLTSFATILKAFFLDH